MDRAGALLAVLLERLNSLQVPNVAVICTASAACVFSELGDLAALEGLTELNERLAPGELGPRVAGEKFETACHVALWRGDLAGLRATSADAMARWRQHPEAMVSSVLVVHLQHLRAEAAAGCFEAAAAVRERIAAHPLAAIQVEVSAVLDRARAAEQLARGDAVGALSTLLALVEQTTFGREHARARLDAAWLLIEAGDVPRAAGLLAGAGAWRNQHPAGLAVQARLAHANGQADQAHQWQQQALDRFRGTPPAVHQDLLRTYAAAASTEVPALPRLATDSWLPPLRERASA